MVTMVMPTQCSMNIPPASLLNCTLQTGSCELSIPCHMGHCPENLHALHWSEVAPQRVTARNSKPNRTSYRLPHSCVCTCHAPGLP